MCSSDMFLLDTFLLDTYDKKSYGGIGKTFDYSLLNSELLNKYKIIIAGGLNSENYDKALSYKPFGLDFNSGLEKEPGVKDEQKIKQLFSKL